MLRRNQKVKHIRENGAGPVTGVVVKVNGDGTIDVLVKGLASPWKKQPARDWEAI